MLKSLIVAAGFALTAINPVLAQDAMKSDAMMKCDDASMMMVQQEMDKMTDDAMKMQKEEAMKSMDMAKDAMKMNKTDECTMHLNEASKAMMKK